MSVDPARDIRRKVSAGTIGSRRMRGSKAHCDSRALAADSGNSIRPPVGTTSSFPPPTCRPMAPWASDRSFSTRWIGGRKAVSTLGPLGQFSPHRSERAEVDRNAVSRTKALKRTFLDAPGPSHAQWSGLNIPGALPPLSLGLRQPQADFAGCLQGTRERGRRLQHVLDCRSAAAAA